MTHQGRGYKMELNTFLAIIKVNDKKNYSLLPDPLTLSVDHKKATIFAKALKKGIKAPDFPKSIIINPHYSYKLSSNAALTLIRAVRDSSIQCQFLFSGSSLSSRAAAELVEEISHGGYPEGLTLDLSNLRVAQDDVKAMFRYLGKGKYPKHFKLKLNNTGLNEAESVIIADQLKKGRFPRPITIHLEANHFWGMGGTWLAQGLMQTASHLNLKLGHSIDQAGELAINDALQQRVINEAALAYLSFVRGIQHSKTLPSLPKDIINYLATFVFPFPETHPLTSKQRNDFVKRIEYQTKKMSLAEHPTSLFKKANSITKKIKDQCLTAEKKIIKPLVFR